MSIGVLGPQDVPAIERLCRGRIEHAMFLLSNLHRAGFEDWGHRLTGLWVGSRGADGGSELQAVACHFGSGNLIIDAPVQTVALAELAWEKSGRALRAVVGPEDQVDEVVEALGLEGGEAAQLDEREGLYRLELSDLRVPAMLRDGAAQGRALASRDLNQIVEWTVRYRVETASDTDTPGLRERVRSDLEASVKLGDVWVLERDGELVARSGFNARIPEAVQIGGVWTPPELRGRGFGRCVVASHLLAARGDGVTTSILFTGDANVAAQRAYVALGFEPVGRYRVLILGRSLESGGGP